MDDDAGAAAAKRVFLETLEASLASPSVLGATLSPAQRDACARYTEMLLETNARTNLTRIVDPAAIAVKHFADSATVLRVCPHLSPRASVVDVGTGAGFPGLVLKILRPDLRLTLMDALGKRIVFLAEVVDALRLTDVALAHCRAEDAGRDPAHRDRYDLVTARAVAALPTLLEWCGPLARPSGGRFVALKTDAVDAELAAAQNAARALNLRLISDTALTLPAVPGDETTATAEEASAPRRRVLVWEKTLATPPRFPRRPAEIKAKPLGSEGDSGTGAIRAEVTPSPR